MVTVFSAVNGLQVAEPFVLVAPLRLDALSLNATLHHALPMMDEGGLGAIPAALRVSPQTLRQSGASGPQLNRTSIDLLQYKSTG